MSIAAARIDYRLLHGIVATQWSPVYAPQRIMIIDDKTASDSLLKDSMKMGRPARVAISIITKEAALNNFKAKKYDGQKVLILTEKPDVLLELVEMGEDIGEIVIGLTRDLSNGIQVTKRASVSQEERPVYEELLKKQVPVYCQYVPADKKVTLESCLQ